MTTSDLSKWIKDLKEECKKIKEWKTTDRLSIISALTFMNGSLASSVTGWNSWLTNAMIMDQFTPEEQSVLNEKFREICLKMLELDIEYTEILSKRNNENKKTAAIKESTAKTVYVA
jgi:hypothetical protein